MISKAQTKASKKYDSDHYQRFNVLIKQGGKEKILEYIEQHEPKGTSLNRFILNIIADKTGINEIRPELPKGQKKETTDN